MATWHERWCDLDYDSAVAMRYHGRRQGFMEFLARLDPALTIMLGGTAFATVVADWKAAAAAASLAAAGTSAINLAFGLSDRARLHEGLFRRWGQLRAELALMDQDDETALRTLEVKRAAIDAESPWQFEALSVMCENEEKKFRRTGPIFKVSWFQRAVANWGTLPGWSPVEDRSATPAP